VGGQTRRIERGTNFDIDRGRKKSRTEIIKEGNQDGVLSDTTGAGKSKDIREGSDKTSREAGMG